MLNTRAQEIADGPGTALTTVGTADADTARRLGDVEIPQDLESAVRA